MTAIITNPVERTRFLKFVIVGLVGAAVDFGTFNLLSAVFKINPNIAQMCSFCAAIISNFLWNRYWIYPDSRTKSIRRQGAQFLVVNIVGLIIRSPIFAFLEPLLGKEFQSLDTQKYHVSANLGHNIALAIAVMAVMMWNFFVNRYWTYNDVGKEKS